MAEECFRMTFSESRIKVDDRKNRRYSEISVRNCSDFTASNLRRPLVSLTILFNALCLTRFCSLHGIPCREESWHCAGEMETARACQMRRRMVVVNNIPRAYYSCVSSINFDQILFINFVLFAVIQHPKFRGSPSGTRDRNFENCRFNVS